MVQNLSRLRSVTTAFLFLMPIASPAQSYTPGQTIAERHQKVLTALAAVGVVIPPSTGTALTFMNLLPTMRIWASLPDPSPPAAKEMPKLHELMGDTYPKLWERLGRFNQLKVEGQEQPRTVLAYPSTTATAAVPILNPDHVLFKYTVTSKASEFFPTTKDVADQLKTFTDAGGKSLDPTTKVLCRIQEGSRRKYGPEQIASCLSKTRKRDTVYRFASGYNGTFSYSDNPQVVQNIVISGGTAQSRQNRLFSGDVAFDPSNVFLTGTDWKNLSASKDVYDEDVQKEVVAKVAKRCSGIGDSQTYTPTTSCLAKLAGPTGWTRVAAAFLPAVDYKIQTQFDFIKSGANFIEPPYPLGHLYDFSFTQDFRRIFPTAQQREDAVAAIAAFTKAKKSTPVSERRAAILDTFRRLAPDENRLSDDGLYYKLIDQISTLL